MTDAAATPLVTIVLANESSWGISRPCERPRRLPRRRGRRLGAVEPRTAYVRLDRVPWAGRAEDKTDDGVCIEF
jgi:hypothetical protein